MRYFKPDEFKDGDKSWFAHMDLNLLEYLDEFRHHWGRPVIVSPAHGAIGRQAGIHINSYHNIDRWGCVRAIDVMPVGMDNAVAAIEAERLARRVGFCGIGLYPHWRRNTKPAPGLHLDTRESIARWGAYLHVNEQTSATEQRYCTFEQAVCKIGVRRDR